MVAFAAVVGSSSADMRVLLLNVCEVLEVCSNKVEVSDATFEIPSPEAT
jgi:hypothetical protein